MYVCTYIHTYIHTYIGVYTVFWYSYASPTRRPSYRVRLSPSGAGAPGRGSGDGVRRVIGYTYNTTWVMGDGDGGALERLDARVV